MDWTEEVAASMREDVIRRLTRACVECSNDLKKIVSVPAPRKFLKSGRLVAKTKAVPGVPPRKLSGRGRASITYKVDRLELTGVVGTNVVYMPVHEYDNGHKWVEPTLKQYGGIYNKILAGEL